MCADTDKSVHERNDIESNINAGRFITADAIAIEIHISFECRIDDLGKALDGDTFCFQAVHIHKVGDITDGSKVDVLVRVIRPQDVINDLAELPDNTGAGQFLIGVAAILAIDDDSIRIFPFHDMMIKNDDVYI